MIKPTNSVWDGGTQTIAGKYDWWMNSLIIFGVDGSLHNRDNSNYGEVNDEDLLSDEILCDASHILSADDAWRLARAFLNREKAKADAGQESLLDVYKSLGYIDAEFVTDENGVVTGDILYVRETIHAVKDVEK